MTFKIFGHFDQISALSWLKIDCIQWFPPIIWNTDHPIHFICSVIHQSGESTKVFWFGGQLAQFWPFGGWKIVEIVGLG